LKSQLVDLQAELAGLSSEKSRFTELRWTLESEGQRLFLVVKELDRPELIADHLTPQFLIVIQKYYLGNISRTETRLRARN
jgi:hypothetical protein